MRSRLLDTVRDRGGRGVPRDSPLTRRPYCCFVTVAVLLLAGCGYSTASPPVSPPVVGPCAGQPPGCGTSSGTTAALAAGRWAALPNAPLAARADDAVV